MFKCPDDPTQPTNDTPPHVPVSYGYNTQIGTKNSPGNVSGDTLAQLNAPASTVLLGEVQGNTADVTNPLEGGSACLYLVGAAIYGAGATGSFYGVPVTGVVPYATYTSTPVHTNGSNWLAADGHVKFLTPAKVSGGPYGAPSPSYVQTEQSTPCGTGSMSNALGNTYTLTFSAT